MELLDYVFVDFDNYKPAISVDCLKKPCADDWELILCPADGNCFYHALSMSTEKFKPPVKIRHDLLKYIKNNNYKLPNIDEVKKRIMCGIECDLCNMDMSANVWANHEEIQLCSRMYDIVICIWNADLQMWTACFPKDDVFLLSQCRKAVFMHSSGVHFNLLRRKKKRF